jgi:pyruvate carboxylase
VFFYGMEPGEEISVDLERGKTLIVRYLASSEPHEDGTRTVFFELNGQPRSVRVADRTQVVEHAPPRRPRAATRATSARRCRGWWRTSPPRWARASNAASCC